MDSINRALSRMLLVAALAFLSSCGSTSTMSSNFDYDRFYVYAGLPEVTDYPNPLKILYNIGYVAGYDEVRGVPAWVAYRVFRVDNYDTSPRPGRFLIDERTENRITHDTYTNSEYDRGHMTSNFVIGTRYGEEAQRDNFLLTNIIPGAGIKSAMVEAVRRTRSQRLF